MWKELRRRKMKWFNGYLFLFMLIFFLVIYSSSPGWAVEELYPNKPINIIVPYAPDSSIGMVSRIMGDKIQEFLGQPLISVYKPGASGALGTSFVAGAKPDGYTILAGSTTPIVQLPLVKKLNYKAEDFIILNALTKSPIYFVVKADARWKTLEDFVEEARKSPGKLSVSNYGKLSSSHLLAEIISKIAGINLTHIPYKSSGEAQTAVLGRHADAGCVSAFLLPGIRVLATGEEKRLEGMPDVPTLKELGYPVVMSLSHFFCFPKGTPQKIVDRFCDAQQKAVEKYSKEIKAAFKDVMLWLEFLTIEETRKKFKEQEDLYIKNFKELGITPE